MCTAYLQGYWPLEDKQPILPSQYKLWGFHLLINVNGKLCRKEYIGIFSIILGSNEEGSFILSENLQLEYIIRWGLVHIISKLTDFSLIYKKFQVFPWFPWSGRNPTVLTKTRGVSWLGTGIHRKTFMGLTIKTKRILGLEPVQIQVQ